MVFHHHQWPVELCSLRWNVFRRSLEQSWWTSRKKYIWGNSQCCDEYLHAILIGFNSFVRIYNTRLTSWFVTIDLWNFLWQSIFFVNNGPGIYLFSVLTIYSRILLPYLKNMTFLSSHNNMQNYLARSSNLNIII